MVKTNYSFLKRAICLAALCLVCLQIYTINVSAASKNWQLLYNPALPSSENLKYLEYQCVTTISQSEFHVTRVGGEATVWAHSNHGLNSYYQTEATTKVDTAKGKQIKLIIEYHRSGTSYNNPYGYFKY